MTSYDRYLGCVRPPPIAFYDHHNQSRFDDVVRLPHDHRLCPWRRSSTALKGPGPTSTGGGADPTLARQRDSVTPIDLDKPTRPAFSIDAILADDRATTTGSETVPSTSGADWSRVQSLVARQSHGGGGGSRFDRVNLIAGGSRAAGRTSGKRVRTIFTQEQLDRLEREFERQQYMVGTERCYLAAELGLVEAQVKVWFQNRRIKWRRQTADAQRRQLAAAAASEAPPSSGGPLVGAAGYKLLMGVGVPHHSSLPHDVTSSPSLSDSSRASSGEFDFRFDDNTGSGPTSCDDDVIDLRRTCV